MPYFGFEIRVRVRFGMGPGVRPSVDLQVVFGFIIRMSVAALPYCNLSPCSVFNFFHVFPLSCYVDVSLFFVWFFFFFVLC